MHRHQSFKLCNGEHNFSSNGWVDSGVQAKPEFEYQNCVKLIGHGGAHKHSCALKYLSIQNTCSITNVLPTSLTTCLKSKIKNTFKVNRIKQEKLTNVCSLMRSIKWRCKQINKKKIFFATKICFEGMSVCRKCKHYPQGSFVLLSFYGELLVIYRFSSNFACPYLGASHFGRPPIFRK